MVTALRLIKRARGLAAILCFRIGPTVVGPIVVNGFGWLFSMRLNLVMILAMVVLEGLIGIGLPRRFR